MGCTTGSSACAPARHPPLPAPRRPGAEAPCASASAKATPPRSAPRLRLRRRRFSSVRRGRSLSDIWTCLWIGLCCTGWTGWRPPPSRLSAEGMAGRRGGSGRLGRGRRRGRRRREAPRRPREEERARSRAQPSLAAGGPRRVREQVVGPACSKKRRASSSRWGDRTGRPAPTAQYQRGRGGSRRGRS